MIYYHGSSVQISKPDVLHSGKRLDFGKVFYVTTVEEQAIRWTKRKAAINGADVGIVSTYEFREAEGFRVYKTYDQIAFIHQEAIDAMLQYQGCFEVTL